VEKKRKPKKRMEDYGYKGIMVYILEHEYEAMREYCFNKRLKHSSFVRGLIVDKLKKEGVIKKGGK
jgi:hypothetical protein